MNLARSVMQGPGARSRPSAHANRAAFGGPVHRSTGSLPHFTETSRIAHDPRWNAGQSARSDQRTRGAEMTRDSEPVGFAVSNVSALGLRTSPRRQSLLTGGAIAG